MKIELLNLPPLPEDFDWEAIERAVMRDIALMFRVPSELLSTKEEQHGPVQDDRRDQSVA